MQFFFKINNSNKIETDIKEICFNLVNKIASDNRTRNEIINDLTDIIYNR